MYAGLKVICAAMPCWLEMADCWGFILDVPHLRAMFKVWVMLQEAGQEDIPRGPSAWCCTLDADVHLLLTVEEEQQYLERSRKAARTLCANLVPCPQPDCEGMAVVGQGEKSCQHLQSVVLHLLSLSGKPVVRSRQQYGKGCISGHPYSTICETVLALLAGAHSKMVIS